MTSHLKEYPLLFAKGMAQAIFDGILKKHRAAKTSDRQLPEGTMEGQWIRDVMEVAPHISAHGFLPDFQPAACG